MNHITPIRVLYSVMALVFLFLAVSGALVPVMTPDTRGYIWPWMWSYDIWGGRRTPVLGFLLAPFGKQFALYPTIIVGLFFGAVYCLYRNVTRFGVSERAALALTLPLLISNSVLRYSREIHAEFPGIVLFLFALALLIRLQEIGSRSFWRSLAYMLSLGAAYLIRPSLLPFVVLMPILFASMSYLRTRNWQAPATLLVLLLSIAPFLTVSTFRYFTQGDFNTVSFGGFQMTGVASSILSEKIIPKLLPKHRELARSILEKREALLSAGEIGPMVFDKDLGERSYRRTARSYFDILASNSDVVLYKVVSRGERIPGEGWVQFNQRMMGFCLDVIRAAPFDYAMWVVGAVRSAVGTAVAHNFPFVLSLVSLIVIYMSLLFATRVPELHFPPLDVPVLSLITIIFTTGAGILPVLVTFPLIRYVSTSALFLPSLLFYLVIALCSAPRPVRSRTAT